MMAAYKVLRAYFDIKGYMQPTEVDKAFKIYNKYLKFDIGSEDWNKTKEELLLLLRVMSAKDNQTFQMEKWKDSDGNPIAVLRILEIVTTSMFEGGQDDG